MVARRWNTRRGLTVMRPRSATSRRWIGSAPRATRRWRSTRRRARRGRAGAQTGTRGAPRRPGAGRRPAHFRAMGIDPARLGGPIVGIASTWTGTMPCNLNQRELSDRAADGDRRRRAACRCRSTRSPSRTTSRRARPACAPRLISREVIADSIELMVHAHDFDAVLCLVGCDKTVPAALMALARVDKPALVLYSGPMRAGRWRGARRDDPGRLGGRRRLRARRRTARASSTSSNGDACPGPGTCAGHFTANTMAVALDCLGLARIGDGLIPAAATDEKAAAAERAGRLAVALPARGPTARALPRPPRAAQRDGRHRGHRRIDATACCTCSRSPTRRASR